MPLFRIKQAKDSEEVESLTEHLQKALFIVIIGCEDDVRSGKAKFIAVAHQCKFYQQLEAWSGPSELKPLVRLAMDTLESTAVSLLNVSAQSGSAAAAAATSDPKARID